MISKSQQPAWMRATQLAAALCLAATPALAQMDGAVTTEPEAPDTGIEEGEEGAFDEAAPGEGILGDPSAEEDAARGENLGADPSMDPGAADEGTIEESEPMQEEQPIEEGSEELGDQGAMLPGGLDEMGADEQAQQSFTGQVRSVDLESGTVEIEAVEAGTVSLKGEPAQLQELEPGQSISLTYEDRDDGRWISEIQEPKSEPAMEEQTEAEKSQAESVQQPQGKRMGEGEYGTRAEKAEGHDEEKAEKSEPALEEKADDHGEDDDEEKAEKSEPAMEEKAEAHGADKSAAEHGDKKSDTEAMKSEKADKEDAEEAKAEKDEAEDSEAALEERPEDGAKKAEEHAKTAEDAAKKAEDAAKRAEQQAKKAEQQARRARRGAQQKAEGSSAQMEMAPTGQGQQAREGKAEDTAAGMPESGLAGFGSDIQRDLQDEPMKEQGAQEIKSFGDKDDPTGLGAQGAGPSFSTEPDTGEPEGVKLP